MTGTGTQADPFKPATWDEFLSCTTADGKYTELSEGGGVFDMNDFYPEGITEPIPLRGFINGNGWTIKNARYEGSQWAFVMSSSTSDGQLKSLNFEDFYVTASGGNASLLHTAYSGRMLERCRFSGRVDARAAEYPCVLYGGIYTSEVYRSSFNIEYSGNFSLELSSNWTTQFKCCNFKLTCLDDENTFAQTVGLSESYLEGDIGGLLLLGGSGVTTANSVLNAKIRSSLRIAYGSVSNILVNTDKYSGELPSGCIGVTTEQLTNAEYLRSLGFPIQT